MEIPGAAKLFRSISLEFDKLKKAISNTDLDEAKKILPSLVALLREAQVAAKIRFSGETVTNIGRTLTKNKKQYVEIDTISKVGNKTYFTQVKSGSAVAFGIQSRTWDDFVRQADRTCEMARESGATVRYVADNIGDDAREYLEKHQQ